VPVAGAVTGAAVRRVLARLVGRRGAPRRWRSANGAEFIREVLQQWLPEAGAEALPVASASPWENGFIESFPRRFRDEFWERAAFESVADAHAKGKWFQREYNTIRPRRALDYKTPKEFSDECDRGLHGQPPQDGNG